MKYIAFTQKGVDSGKLYPFTLTRKVQDITVGITTIRQKWEKSLHLSSFDLDEVSYLPPQHQQILLQDTDENDSVYVIQGNLLPTVNALSKIKKLKQGDCIISAEGEILVCHISKKHITKKGDIKKPEHSVILHDVVKVKFPWDIFLLNGRMLAYDFAMTTKKKTTATIDKSNRVSNAKNIFIEKGAVVKHAMINADEGPVYISKNALIMEGACLRGPLFIGEGAVVKMGAKIYGATTIGPGCTVGGEIKNVVMFGFSNKAHDGYLGDSVVGEWCNMGAGTSNSNLKNTAGNIVVHLQNQKYEAGMKCGVLMGDFSRTAINTSINTGTVIGVSCNIFGEGLTPKHIPSFSWGMSNEVQYRLDKALSDADAWKKLKGKTITETEKTVLTNIYKQIK